MPSFAVEIVKHRAPRPEPSFQAKLVQVLKSRLTKETAFFAVPHNGARAPSPVALPARHGIMSGVPDLIFVHRGRAFGLELMHRNGSLSGDQRVAQLALRDAGMRVEVACDLDEALRHLRDMGIPLRAGSENAFRCVRAV